MRSGVGEPIVVPGDFTQEGDATYYGPGFHGKKTASGEVFDQYALTAAHRTLPFGTRLLVTNLVTGQKVIVRINDRGPFTQAIIDLSYGAAKAIGLLKTGRVRIQALQ
jgi:peptidoglycan lytic transglycosylase